MTISQLPDDVITHCFSFLSQSERLTSACLVSKRFHALCTSPRLLQQLEAFCRGVAGAQSLLLFLARHGQHVATLHLRVQRCSGEAEDELTAAVASCLSVVGAKGELHKLELKSVCGGSQDLEGAHFSAASMEGLSRLGSLTRLQLQECTPPAGLSALLQLRHLDVHFCSDSPDEEELDAALGRLRQLTTLALGGYVGRHRLPAIAGLPQLQRFYWASMSEEGVQLPDGPWLHSIAWLCLSPELLCSSVDALAAATRLELLSFSEPPSCQLLQSPAWRQFWAWAARHPPLRGLHLDFGAEVDEENTVWHLMDELVRLASIRPAFKLSRLEQRAFCDMLETELV